MGEVAVSLNTTVKGQRTSKYNKHFNINPCINKLTVNVLDENIITNSFHGTCISWAWFHKKKSILGFP